jgi:hypothetical protein
VYTQSNKESLLGNNTQKSLPVKKDGTSEPEAIIYLPRKKDTDSKWKHFFMGMGMMGLWGAGEGALELVLNYMRRRRPE